jgi:hypothetical protein
MKRMIRLPFDANALKRISSIAFTLRSDEDRDVLQAAKEVGEQLAIIEPGRGLEGAEDLIDRKKEEEEEDMLKLEEKEAVEAQKKEEEARNEFRRKLAEKEDEMRMKVKIFGHRVAKKQAVTVPDSIKESAEAAKQKKPMVVAKVTPALKVDKEKKPSEPVHNGSSPKPVATKVPTSSPAATKTTTVTTVNTATVTAPIVKKVPSASKLNYTPTKAKSPKPSPGPSKGKSYDIYSV